MAVRGVTLDGERPSEDERFAILSERIAKLEEVVFAENDEEIVAWKPWDGISKDYQYGALVTHKDTIWRSDFKGQNVWEPGTIGTEALWVRVG